MKEIRVGLIGYKFMGKAHSNAYRQVGRFFEPAAIPVMKVLCGRDEKGVRKAAEKFGWQEYETDYKRLIKRDDLDLIDITTPNNSHCELVVAAAREGKNILCEKPLAVNLREAKEMLNAVEKTGVKHMIGFNYRRVPAIGLARKLIEEGRIGKIYHFRSTYLQDWIVDPEFPLNWRFQKDIAGSGALGDLLAHHIDLARYLVGELEEVAGMDKTFIKERPVSLEADGLNGKAGKEKGKVTVDDATLFLAKFKNGALGSFEATRVAPGRKNYNRFEINGSEGSLIFNFERMNELEFFSREDLSYAQGFRTILVTESEHPYISAWWPPGHTIGYEQTFIHQAYDLMEYLAEDKMPSPNFLDGVKCQEVLEAVSNSIETKGWVKI
ncbi:MAG: dehydrogenase [bacterium (Candidatus Ratteibacteria) CG_4_10_14_3_um_filter_41_18]|uniref:Dehydrogenase n=1 Tax=bacterium (Candidatus Ratteibacteria) CG_4_10_14_3_um_filter_41_18 TaxID=2014287 RepID=A0A2M7M424_9BACT|nr:MAG: dehydrogenase [bacterium (Candidatus Ratteibacteria) CG_4_10_14_3_um_filter_41_18]